MAQRNFARGEPPPSSSWEWVGVAKPPGRRPEAKKPGIPVVVATMRARMRETIVIEKKKRPWLWLAAGGALGFLLGYKTGSY